MPDASTPGRRDFLLRCAGAGVPLPNWAGYLGGSQIPTQCAAGVAPAVLSWLAGRADALPRGEGADLAVLGASIALEHHAIALYEWGLQRRLFPPGLRDFALEFRGDHLGHRDTQAVIARERGFEPPELLREALEVEHAAQLAYLKVISQIRTRDYLLSAAFVMVDEVRHVTVWRRVLGRRLY